MPPIFGIIQTKSSGSGPIPSQQTLLSLPSLQSLKTTPYITPRTFETLSTSTALFAATILKSNPLQAFNEVILQQEPYTIIADTTLYKKPDASKPDVEVILHAWKHHGKACVKQLYGDFAFVVYNSETAEIFCGRDHFGVRPLYYTIHEGSFIFSSELRMILAVLPDKLEIRHEYLLDTLMTVKNPKDLTPFINIYRLKPAHSLSLINGNLSTDCYWQPDPSKKIVLSNEKDYVTFFREKLVQAVQARSRDNNTGAELSGGLDSSAITGIAAQHGKVNSFSNVFPSDTGIDFTDEQEFMKKMVEFAGINWYPIDHHSQTIIQILKHTLAIHGIYIQQNFNIFSKSLYEKAAESGTRVLLSGFGGDELVSARISNPWNQYIDEGQWKVIFDEIFHNGIGLKTIIKPALLAARYFKSKLFNGKFTSGAFTPELLDRRFANLPLNREFASKNNLRQRLGDNYSRLKQKTMTQRQIDRIMMDHLPQRLEYCYTAAAQYGIEYRYPLLDVDLVETALAFPPWVKQHHGVNRYLFREAMKGLVPEEIRLRNDKSGSTIPQTLFSLVNEKEEILNVFSKASESAFLKDIFDFPKFPVWYDKLAKRDPADMNYMMPGAFYDYLMILLYYGE